MLDAIRAAANDLGNTPAICGKSYVHETIVNAFEVGALEQFADMLRSARSSSCSEKVLVQVYGSDHSRSCNLNIVTRTYLKITDGCRSAINVG